MSQSTINPRKNLRGRPRVDSEQINARLPRETLAALDAYAANGEEKPMGRTEAIRAILKDWLETRGYLRSVSGQDPNRDTGDDRQQAD